MARQTSSRISKRSSSRMAKARSRMSTTGGSASGGVLERMVHEATAGDTPAPVEDTKALGEDSAAESEGGVALDHEDVYMASQEENAYEGKGKGKMAALADEQAKRFDDKPFRLFDLPTEIRLEIYRACLTRPYKILLSKPGKPKPSVEDEEDAGDHMDGVVREEPAAARTVRAAGSDDRQRRSGSSTGGRGSQQSPRRRGGGRGPTRPTLLRASTSGAQSQSQSSASASQDAPISARLNTLLSTTSTSSNNTTRRSTTIKKTRTEPKDDRPRMEDPLIVAILRANKDVYKEARDVLYSENVFSLDIFTAVNSLAALHQRSRRRIKYVELEIPTYTEILEAFSETVRLSLRYCFGLRKLVIHTPFHLPGSDNSSVTGGTAGGNTTVYANGFDILRWLPQGCEVVLEGTKNKDIDAVVGKHMRLAGMQDKLAYARRQLISNDADTTA